MIAAVMVRPLRTLLVLAIGVGIAAASVTAASAAAKVQRLVSPGGIEAWFVQDATVPLIAMEFGFDGGATQDPADKPGVGHLVANLIDEGSGDLDSRSFHERMERRAIELSFSSTRDYFRGSLRMLTEHRDEAFDLLRLALTKPRFEPADVERVRAQLSATLRRQSANPGWHANKKFLELAFGDHPYGRPASGTLDSIGKISIDDLRSYAKRVLARSNLKIAVVGDIDAAALGRLLDATFGALPAKADLVAVADVVATKPPKREFVAMDVPQTAVAFGGPGLKRNDPDFMAGYVVNHIVGGGTLTSRLYHEVREKRGLAYSVYGTLLWMEHSALFIGNTGTRADRVAETLTAIDAEIKRMADEGPSATELEEAKSYLKGSQMLSLDTSSKLATALLQYQQDKLPIDYIEKRNALVDAVTLEDARRVAKRLWADGLLSVVVGRPAAAAAQSPAAATPPRAN
ncbi:zinc protease [Rhodopseudomonas faecalis]|uniref:Zinc protease n=2 Tax=Rhodopseudomonas faecalis TaxID=99655 RepID=A0A318TQ15_9BRAD|nr:zinc protease [Rhodopseudomonas faecalis]